MKKELTEEELLAQGYKFYNWEEASERFGVNLVAKNNRSVNIKRNIEGIYEYQLQKQKKSKGVILREAGIWIQERDNVFLEVASTKKGLEAYERLLEFYLDNYNMVDYLSQTEIASVLKVSKSTITEFEDRCREIGLMEKKSEPTYREVFNKFTGKMDKIEVPTMTQYYFVSFNNQNGKFATSQTYFNHCWKWIYNRANFLSSKFLENNPEYNVVTQEVYNGFKKQAQAEFSQLYGFRVYKGNTRKIDVERLFELKIELLPTYEPIPKERQYHFIVEPKKNIVDISMVENDVYDITKPYTEEIEVVEQQTVNVETPKLELAFGRSVKTKFEAIVWEPSEIDGSFLCA